jgi:hypothetical protein
MKVDKLPAELGYGDHDGISIILDSHDSEELRTIINGIMPLWARLFAEKNKKYAGLAGNDLGSKGKFVDVYRKVMLLKSRIWDDHEVIGEDNVEVIYDTIGHLFLMLYDMAGERWSI